MDKPIIISAVAQKGGVGKSTTVLGLAKTASQHQIKTCIIDFDSQASVSTSMIDMSEQVRDSYAFVKSKDSFEPYQINDYLSLIPASTDLLKFDDESFDSYFVLGERIDDQLSHFDLIIIDTPGTLRTTVTAALTASHYMYSPIELNAYSLNAYDSVTKLFKNVKKRLNNQLNFIGFLPNRVHSTRVVDGKRIPFQLDERDIYAQLSNVNESGIIGLVDELAEIRRYVTFKQDSDNKTHEQITAFSDAILQKIGLLDE